MKIQRIVFVTLAAVMAFCVYITGAVEIAFPAQWGGNTYWQGTVLETSVGSSKNPVHRKKTIALTFDDGPSKFTSMILDQLRAQEVKATFFMMGRQVDAFPDIARRVVDEGHEIGNHGYGLVAQKGIDKLYLFGLSENELLKSQNAIVNTTGFTPKYYRPPGGQLGRNLWRQVSALELTTIAGTLPFPEASAPSDVQMNLIAENIKPGSIIILHDGDDVTPNSSRGQNVVELMPKLFAYLQYNGYQIVSLDTLFGK